MSDFGEPWKLERTGLIKTRRGRLAFGDDGSPRRAVACANALAGISDPAEQVRRWKAWDVWLDRHASLISAFADLSPDEIARLAAKWTPDE